MTTSLTSKLLTKTLTSEVLNNYFLFWYMIILPVACESLAKIFALISEMYIFGMKVNIKVTFVCTGTRPCLIIRFQKIIFMACHALHARQSLG